MYSQNQIDDLLINIIENSNHLEDICAQYSNGEDGLKIVHKADSNNTTFFREHTKLNFNALKQQHGNTSIQWHDYKSNTTSQVLTKQLNGFYDYVQSALKQGNITFLTNAVEHNGNIEINDITETCKQIHEVIKPILFDHLNKEINVFYWFYSDIFEF